MARVSERRAKPRVSLGEKVIVCRGSELFDGAALNISASGLAAVCPLQGQRGERVQLKVFLPCDPEALPVEGLLIRREARSEAFVWAIRFELMEPRVTALIETYIRDRLRQKVRTRMLADSNATKARGQGARSTRLHGMTHKASDSLVSEVGRSAGNGGHGSDERTPQRMRSLFKSAVESLISTGGGAKKR